MSHARTASCALNGSSDTDVYKRQIFYIGGSPSAGALLLAMSARRPLNVAGVLLSELPADYSIPQDGVNAPQVAYLCGGAARAADYFGKVNGVTGADARPLEHAVLYTSQMCIRDRGILLYVFQ